MSGEQCLIALQALSYLQFAKIDSPLYDKATHQIAIRAMTNEEMMYRIVSQLPQGKRGTYAMSLTYVYFVA